jgi:cell division septum initiation protein DivIVA
MARDILGDMAPASTRRGRDILAEEVPTPSGMDLAFEPTVPPPPPPFEAAKIPESTVYGGALGAVAPEMLKYGGKALQVLPYGQPATGTLGRSMEVSGEALRGRRGASAVSGAAGGGIGETIYQTATSMGAPQPVAIGASVVGGMLAPTALGQAAARSPFLGSIIRKAEEGGYGEAAQRFASRLRGGKPAESREAIDQVVRALEDEAQSIRGRGQAQANQIMSTAEAEIARLGPGAAQEAARIRKNATDQAAALLFRANQQVEQRQLALRRIKQEQRFGEQTTIGETTRRAVGEPREATDVGQTLRERITAVQGDRLKRRADQAATDKKAVMDEVNAKQSAGVGVQDEPKYGELIADLERRLGVGAARQEAPFAEMTEPRTRRTLQEIYSVLRPTQSEVEGVVATPKVSFESLDALRRRLGEIYRSPPAEGAAAMDARIAGDFYAKLSEILGEYSPSQKQFISNYETLSRELDVFKGAAGRKATAVDRYDPESFATDPAKLPTNYFSTRTGVQDLIELTGGDKKFVEQQAASFVSRQLEGVRTPQAAAEFEARNRDWLREFPDLQASVKRYIDSLGFAETRGRRLTEAGKALRTEIGELPIRARKEATQLTKEAEAQARAAEGATGRTATAATRSANEARAAANAQARLLERTQDQVKYFDNLISSGDTPKLAAAAPVIKSDPQLMNSFLEGVRITVSRMDPQEIGDNYRRVIRPALEKAALANKSQLDKIDRQVRLIEVSGTPELRPGLMMTAIRNTLAASGGMGTSRLMDSLGLGFADSYLGAPDATR